MTKLIELRTPGTKTVAKLVGKLDPEQGTIIVRQNGQDFIFDLREILAQNSHKPIIFGKLKSRTD